jgi:saccharopine dehydrogenase (NAD+, L-glutamate forming)
VLAGSGGAVKFLDNGKYKYIPYHRLFRRTEVIHLNQYGKFEGYANRDSLKYQEAYGLQNVDTIFRGTLRRLGFSRAWNYIVNLGATDDSYVISGLDKMLHRDFTNCFLPYHPSDSIERKVGHYLNIAQDDFDIWEKFESIGIFSDEKIGLSHGTPAQILEHILRKSWTLNSKDKDLIVMYFNIKAEKEGMGITKSAEFCLQGLHSKDTALSKTVGMPLAAACKLLLENTIVKKGCFIPVDKEVYTPIFNYLIQEGFEFSINEMNTEKNLMI